MLHGTHNYGLYCIAGLPETSIFSRTGPVPDFLFWPVRTRSGPENLWTLQLNFPRFRWIDFQRFFSVRDGGLSKQMWFKKTIKI